MKIVDGFELLSESAEPSQSKRGHYHTSFCSTNQYQNNEGRYIMPLPLIGVDLMFKIMSISCGFIIYYLSLSCMQIYRVSRGVLLIWIAQKVHLS